MLRVSCFVPCYNNRNTIAVVIDSLNNQSVDAGQVMVIDDGSTDASAQIARSLGANAISLASNAGRGAIRAEGIDSCTTDLLLSCDATNRLDSSFLASAVPWFNESTVAAVFGRLIDPSPSGVSGRWRARHLLLQGVEAESSEYSSLATWSYVARVSFIRDVGNFRRDLRHSEDVELGDRLLKAGYKVVFEPKCIAYPLVSNTIRQCLERHWRWYVARHGRMTLTDLCRWAGLAWRSMLVEDMRAKDPAAAVISLILPFHHWWRSQREKANRKIHT